MLALNIEPAESNSARLSQFGGLVSEAPDLENEETGNADTSPKELGRADVAFKSSPAFCVFRSHSSSSSGVF